MRKLYRLLIALAVLLPELITAQTSNDYIKAGWMTTRMYGGNRSGHGPNWLIMDHNRGYDFVKDADGSYDLTGGWHDCGDHVKFGQTQFYAGYVLLLGYSAFPEGYDDYYSANYSGYHSSGDFTWEGKRGAPNGIPDILDEVKYATDYFIKCARDGSTFYSQVGNGNNDHKHWVTSVRMAELSNSEGGEANGSREIKKNPNDGSMASFCGATLALMSRVYRHFDPTYADLCLQHAQYAYSYASNHKTNSGGGTITGSFYGPDNDWKDNYVCLCTEMYYATGDESYKTEALSYESSIKEHNWVLDYENSNDLAAYNLAKLGSTAARSALDIMTSAYINSVNGEGCITSGSSWGPLRYSASAAFSIALSQSLDKATNINSALQGTVDYIMGYNSANRSFIVGFGSNAPRKPHHRNVFLSDADNENSVSIPGRNNQHGYMVGGSLNPSSFPDDIKNYQTSEGGIDYNAGLVGALGYICSRLAPVDQSKFGFSNCSAPDLGADQSLCGAGSVTLQTNLPSSNRTFTWQRDGTNITGSSNSLQVSQPGIYLVTVDSSGCVTSDEVEVSASIPAADLGNNIIYEGSPITLNAGVSGGALTFQWSKDGEIIASAQGSTLEVNSAGTYSVTISGAGCDSQSDEITINNPPSFTFTSTPVSIDGSKDEIFSDTYAIETSLSGTIGAPNISATWSGLWDNTNVYLFVSVIDNALYNDSGNTWYEDDGVEVFFDGGNEKANSYDANDFQLGFIWDRTTVIEGSNNQNSVNGIEFSIVESTNGYDLEIKIPWSSLRVNSPSIGTVIGFDLGINDDDNGSGRENKISWFQTEDQGWTNPSVLGEVTLLDEVFVDLTPVVEVAAEKTITLPENTTTLSATASGGNGVLLCSWEQLSGPTTASFSTTSQLNPSVSNLTAGTYVFSITITDEDGDFVSDQITLIVEPEPTITQTIELSSGWNLISFYVLADNMNVQTVFAGILSQIDIIKNTDGFFIPNDNPALQSLEILEIGEGYLIKMKSPATLNITGEEVLASSLVLKNGWNLIGYPFAQSSDIATKVASASGAIIVIKNFDGSFSTGGLNGITDFEPGNGYYIQTSNSTSIDW